MPKLLEELKRRNVIRVSLAYLVLSWLLLQVADVLFEALRLGETALTLMVAILALGFIPVVVFSWIYELTPEGVKRESEIDRSQSVTAETGHRLNVAIVLLLVVALGLFAWDRFFASPGESLPQAELRSSADRVADLASPPRSIAVLPFADMSPQGDQAYFADGISEELLNVLARVNGLKVAARTSSFKFRGAENDIAQIGQALNVGTVLEGSVRKSGDQVRITAQLIDVAGGFHLWSESYDRKLDNIFALQDEIATAIVDALKLKLNLAPSSETKLADSGEAYDLYLRGRELAREPSKAGLLRAIQYYEQALVINPDFAPALGAIASAWVWLEDYGGYSAQDAFDRAEPAARRALELDPNRADALTAMGLLEDNKYNNQAAAKAYFERALAINPTFTEASTLYADALADIGETESALEVRRNSVERDPLSGFLKSRLASSYTLQGQLDESERLLDEIFAANPEDTYGYEERANKRFIEGRLAEAVRDYGFLHENRPGDPYAAANTAISYALMDDADNAQFWIEAARARGANNRWELEARKSFAEWSGDWDAMFRAGQLHLAKDGATWQGQASLGKGDWEAARASFLRTLSRLNFRQGDEVTGNVLEPLVGLALAEKQLGIASWEQHAAAAQAFAENRLKKSANLRSWPGINLNYFLAQIAAMKDNAKSAASYLNVAFGQNFLRPSFIVHDPFFASVRSDPTLKAIAGQMRERALVERRKLDSNTG